MPPLLRSFPALLVTAFVLRDGGVSSLEAAVEVSTAELSVDPEA